MCSYPGGINTRSDKAYLFHRVFTPEMTKELEDRGYDITTLKFEISPKKGNQKFVFQREQSVEQTLAADPKDAGEN